MIFSPACASASSTARLSLTGVAPGSWALPPSSLTTSAASGRDLSNITSSWRRIRFPRRRARGVRLTRTTRPSRSDRPTVARPAVSSQETNRLTARRFSRLSSARSAVLGGTSPRMATNTRISPLSAKSVPIASSTTAVNSCEKWASRAAAARTSASTKTPPRPARGDRPASWGNGDRLRQPRRQGRSVDRSGQLLSAPRCRRYRIRCPADRPAWSTRTRRRPGRRS